MRTMLEVAAISLRPVLTLQVLGLVNERGELNDPPHLKEKH